MKKNIALVAFAVASFGVHAQSVTVEGSVGGSAFQKMGNGMYYQEGLSHNLDLVAPAGRIGIDADILTPNGFIPGMSVNLSYLYFGQASIKGNAAPDATGQFAHTGGYDPKTNKCVGDCGPIRYFDTGGSLQALALTLEPYWKSGDWRFSVEGGAAVFKGTWTSKMTVVSDTSPWGDKGSVESLSHKPTLQLTWVAGASVAYKNVILRYTYINTPSKNVSDQNVPLGFRAAHMLTLGYRW